MKKLFVLFFMLLSSLGITAQCDMDINLTSQIEVDNFLIDYANCLEVVDDSLYAIYDESLIISGDDITNLNGLSLLKEIGGNSVGFYGRLSINCSNLTNVDELSNLTSVGKSITLQDCSSLVSLAGFENLTYCERININNCTALEDLSGLDNIPNFPAGFALYNAASLTSLNGFNAAYTDFFQIIDAPLLTDLSSMSSIDSCHNLLFTNCISLENLSGLENMRGVSELYLYGNTALTEISALNEVLETVCQNIYIEQHENLLNLDGLSNVVSVEDNLQIVANFSLQSLSGLEQLTFAEFLIIHFNPVLESLNGLNNLTEVFLLEIKENASLLNFIGLENLEIVSEWRIQENHMLTSLEGVNPNINSINSLSILFNNFLSDISAIMLDPSIYQGSQIAVGSNVSLSVCCSLIPLLDEGVVEVFVFANAPGCSEIIEIYDSCTPGLKLSLKVYLEGAYENNDTMSTDLTSFIPTTQPYDTAPWFYSGNETLDSIPSNMVDWILVEVRTGTPNLGGTPGTTVVETIPGVLLDNGSVVNENGVPIRFNNLVGDDDYYFAVRHRNHLSVLSANPITAGEQMSYDFTTDISQAFGMEQQKLSPDGKAVLYTGDANADNVIQTTDYDVWIGEPAAVGVYQATDFNLDGIIQVTDYDKWFDNKAKLGIVEFLW